MVCKIKIKHNQTKRKIGEKYKEQEEREKGQQDIRVLVARLESVGGAEDGSKKLATKICMDGGEREEKEKIEDPTPLGVECPCPALFLGVESPGPALLVGVESPGPTNLEEQKKEYRQQDGDELLNHPEGRDVGGAEEGSEKLANKIGMERDEEIQREDKTK